MSDTPKTDAIAHGFYPGGWMNMHEATLHYNMMLDLARQLERELRQTQDELMMKAQQCSAERNRANAAEKELAKERCR